MLARQAFALGLVLVVTSAPSAYAKAQRVPVRPPANVVTDESLATFRVKLGEIAKTRDLKGLKGLVAPTFLEEQLCVRKTDGKWLIGGYIGGGD